MESLKIPAGSLCTRTWFRILAVMSAVQLLVAWFCPVMAIFLIFFLDDPHVSSTQGTMLLVSICWLFANAVVNVLTLCMCIYAATRYFLDPMLTNPAVVRSHGIHQPVWTLVHVVWSDASFCGHCDVVASSLNSGSRCACPAWATALQGSGAMYGLMCGLVNFV
jgi:hypothetical protein